MTTESHNPIIKSIVISGGAMWGFSAYGVIKSACQHNYINLKQVKSYYGTSIGSMFSVLFALDYDFNIMDDFLLKRPWHTIFQKDLLSVIEIFNSMGLYSIDSMREIFMPLLNGKDISIDVTMKEFYEKTGVDLYIYVTDINEYKIVELSHYTHPEWGLIEAVYASASLPLIFKPLEKDNVFYCDGAFINNFPLENCISREPDTNSVFSINLCGEQRDKNSVNNLNKNSTFLEYAFYIINKILLNLMNVNSNCGNIKNKITLQKHTITTNDLFLSLSSQDKRQLLMQLGMDQMDEFLQSLDNANVGTLIMNHDMSVCDEINTTSSSLSSM